MFLDFGEMNNDAAKVNDDLAFEFFGHAHSPDAALRFGILASKP